MASLAVLAAPMHAHAAGVAIRGAGATFPFPIYAQWAAQYRNETGNQVDYEPIGSGAGVERIERDEVDFGASDAPLSPARLLAIGAVQFPVVIGGVVPVVHIGGVRPGQLRLSGAVLAQIYLGRIRRWNDPEIVALNPTLSLPNANITVVHRADASGTSFLWSDYLSQSSPDWKAAMGTATTLAWPVGVAGFGNEGVASYVQRTRFAIGYVEFAYAKQHNLAYCALRNRDGVFVQPGRVSFAAAANAAQWKSDADLAQVLTNQRGPDSWPITGASFVLVRTANGRRSEVIRFFDWAFRQGGPAAAQLEYTQMPDAAVAVIRKSWADTGMGPLAKP
jgi:phosphate transport system substrate-binding protein